MNTTLKHSWASRCSALGFIALILLGNFWLVLDIMGSPIPAWMIHTFRFLLAWLLGCAVAFALLLLRLKFSHDPDGEDR